MESTPGIVDSLNDTPTEGPKVFKREFRVDKRAATPDHTAESRINLHKEALYNKVRGYCEENIQVLKTETEDEIIYTFTIKFN